jgi:hypothetical protein
MENRMLKIEVYPEDKADWPKVRALFEEYRTALRKAFCMHGLTECAGAEILEKKGHKQLKPTAASKAVRSELFGGAGKNRELFPWLKAQLPTFNATIHDCAMGQVLDVWKSHDPSLTKATRGWLVMQGERMLPRMARADLRVRRDYVSMEPHAVGLRLFADKERDTLRLKVRTLDGGRYGIYKRLATGALRCGDPVRFGLRDNDLYLYLPYAVEAEARELDPARVLEVAFGDDLDHAISMRLRAGHASPLDDLRTYHVDAAGAWAFILRHNARRECLDRERRAAGRRGNQGIGNDAAYASATRRLDRLTLGRENALKTWNHTWTARIVKQAERWKCGAIEVFGPPEGLLTESWPWADWRGKLAYKAKAMGIKLAYSERVDAVKELAS